MKKSKRIFIVALGLTAGLSFTALVEAQATSNTNRSSGNQLMKGYVPWYEKAAVSTGPAPGIAAKGGTLLTLQPGSALYLEGGSTLHKYQMNAHSLKGSAVLRSPASGDWVKPLKSGGTGPTVLVVPVRDLKSRESGLDENAYKALNAKENPEIKFTLRSESLAAGRTEGTRGMTAKGDLAVAGVTIPVTLKADAILSKGKIRLKGVHKLKMSDFKITPPSISLLVTAITCTDEIEIHYDVTFAPK